MRLGHPIAICTGTGKRLSFRMQLTGDFGLLIQLLNFDQFTSVLLAVFAKKVYRKTASKSISICTLIITASARTNWNVRNRFWWIFQEEWGNGFITFWRKNLMNAAPTTWYLVASTNCLLFSSEHYSFPKNFSDDYNLAHKWVDAVIWKYCDLDVEPEDRLEKLKEFLRDSLRWLLSSTFNISSYPPDTFLGMSCFHWERLCWRWSRVSPIFWINAMLTWTTKSLCKNGAPAWVPIQVSCLVMFAFFRKIWI